MNNKTLKIAIIGLMSALAYISFTFLQIKIPTPGGTTSFHLGNTFCVLAALLLGGIPGGLAGAIGMGIGDLLDPTYITYAPKTIILKFLIGIFTGDVYKRQVIYEILFLFSIPITLSFKSLTCSILLVFKA